MKINGKISKPLWYDIKCSCGLSVEDKFPIKECLHCKFEKCERSLPKKDFKIMEHITNQKGILIKKQTRIVKEVTIVRGDKYEDIIGWTF